MAARKTVAARTPPVVVAASPGAIPGATARELIVAGLLFAGVIVAIVLLSGASSLVGRHLWLDEIITYLLVTDPSAAHMFDALLHGADSNVPGLHLLLRGMGVVLPLNEMTLRLFSGMAALAALLGLHACLRLVFDRLVSAASTLTLLSGHLFVAQAFDARFYAPWLAACAWFCFCLALLRFRPGSRAARIGLAVMTIVMLSIHYFGVFSFLAIVTADFFTDPQPMRRRILARWPLLFALPMVGVIAFFYFPQRGALSVATWVRPPTPAIAFDFVAQTLLLLPVACVSAAVLAALALRRWRSDLFIAPRESLRPLAGAVALVAVPLIVLAFTYLVQPATKPRYAIPGLAGIAVVLAWLYARLHRHLVIAFVLGFTILSGHRFHALAVAHARTGLELAHYAAIIKKTDPDQIVVFERRHDLYPMSIHSPEIGYRLYMLDFETSEESPGTLAPSTNFGIVERDANRAIVRSYPQIRLLPRRELPRGKRLLLVASDLNVARLQKRFQGAFVTQVGGRMFEVVLPEGDGREPGTRQPG
jgi:hypothetical protein